MRNVGIGSVIICNREEAKVVNEYKENGRSYFVLRTSEGQRSVPAVKVMWNGKNHFVTADGYAVANMVADAEKIISEIKKEMEIWDSENLNPVGVHREEAIDAHFMVRLRDELNVRSDEELGFIVKKVVRELDEI